MRAVMFVLVVAVVGCDEDDDAVNTPNVCCQQGETAIPAPSCQEGQIQHAVDQCRPVCCDTAEGRKVVATLFCAEVFQVEGETCQAPDAGMGGGKTCTCAEGASFAVVSGCEGAAFNDATTASFCRSAVEFSLMLDPETHEFTDGAQYGFPECQVRITCP